MFRLPLSLVAPAGSRGRLTILIFHRVLPVVDPLFPETPTADRFEQHMQWVKDWFNVLPLAPAIDMLYAGHIPSRALAITFDDGYADNAEIAAPVLRRLGLSATFFLATGYLGGGCMWNDRVIEALRGCPADQLDLRPLGLPVYPMTSLGERRRAVDSVLMAIKHVEPERRDSLTESIVSLAQCGPLPPLMMHARQVRSLRELGMDVGAHTISHPILTRLARPSAFAEMADSKLALEEILGESVELFAYPNGVPNQDYSADHVDLARECGFSAAVSTAWGAASMRSHRYQLPRFTPWDRTRVRYGVRLLANFARSEQVAA